MERLFVLYDDRCGLCRWARRWVEAQPAFLEVVFLAATSEAARNTFPTLTLADPPEELLVVSDAGEVYRGGSAWVMVLYALESHREWSLRLGSPTLLPLARQAFTWFSRHRGQFSRWLRLDDSDLSATLRRIEAPSCDPGFPDRQGSGGRSSNQVLPAQRGQGASGWRRQFGP